MFLFSTLVCLFLCLFMCVMFRVSLVFRSASSVVFVCVYFCVSIYLGFLVLVISGVRVVLGSCLSDAMISNHGSLLTYSNLFCEKAQYKSRNDP